jgi:MerR family transcriptional regulator, redox-sensitive transcriptional activator SoxR
VTIGEISERTGLAPSALRFYEAEGLLPEPDRVSGRRRYDESTLHRLAVIQVAQKAGFTISEIKTLMTGFARATPPSVRWRKLAERKLPEVEGLIARAQAMKALLEEGLECDCLRLEDCGVIQRHANFELAAHP